MTCQKPEAHKLAPPSCVTPAGSFAYGIHKPDYQVLNLRKQTRCDPLGSTENNTLIDNRQNFPTTDFAVTSADWVFEIPNPLPFRGTTYITKSWADAKAQDPDGISLPAPSQTSMSEVIGKWLPGSTKKDQALLFNDLPQAVLLALAAHSTDPQDLQILAKMACKILFDPEQQPTGLLYQEKDGVKRPQIVNHNLFEIVANNPYLPDGYKEIMVLRPGAQGASEIIGEFQHPKSHVFEYLRRNSYIPWGHYAANMANDQIRYSAAELTKDDIKGLRHLYYQRTYTRLAQDLKISRATGNQTLSATDLEELRVQILNELCNEKRVPLPFNTTLWGWNYGFSSAANGYRLHASHQMIHQQFALLPRTVEAHYSGQKQQNRDKTLPSYGVGDLAAEFIKDYQETTKSCFFDDYLMAIRQNTRLDKRSDLPRSLIIHEDQNIILFVPKAQTSQWEIQLITVQKIGNILESDSNTRESIDSAMLLAMQTLTSLGAQMITCIEIPKRFDAENHSQRLIYSFMPKLPGSPGAFSEAQLRWINGHYPEDFARVCRKAAQRFKVNG